MRLWRLAALALVALVSCGEVPDVSRAAGDDVLAPYEEAAWPRYLTDLALPRDRDYVILSYLPPAVPLDLRTPETMRATLRAGLSDPAALAEAKTKIGHTVVAWQCGAHQGVTSMTGETRLQATRMMLSGWGIVPLLSTFQDGHLYTEAGFSPRHDLAFRQGKGVVTAVEVDRASCTRLRRALEDFVTHPAQPARNFGLLADPRRFEGGGCLTFAWYLSGAAGVIGDMQHLFRRDIEVRAVQIGAWRPVPPGVVPWRPDGHVWRDTPLSLRAFLGTRWDRGPVVARLSVPDGEAFLGAMIALRDGVQETQDWRTGRVLPGHGAVVERAEVAARRYANGFPVRRLADPDGVAALVLETH